jgi:hypothetical protein
MYLTANLNLHPGSLLPHGSIFPCCFTAQTTQNLRCPLLMILSLLLHFHLPLFTLPLSFYKPWLKLRKKKTKGGLKDYGTSLQHVANLQPLQVTPGSNDGWTTLPIPLHQQLFCTNY